jgi:hypothetical protein
MDIVVPLTDAEARALSTVMVDPQEWAANAVRERARVASEAIIASEVQALIAAGEPIPPTADEIIESAFASGRAVPAAEQAGAAEDAPLPA